MDVLSRVGRALPAALDGGGQCPPYIERSMAIHRNNLTALPGVPHHKLPAPRREFLARSGAGFGAVAMAYLLNANPLRAAAAEAVAGVGTGASPLLSPLAPKV